MVVMICGDRLSHLLQELMLLAFSESQVENRE